MGPKCPWSLQVSIGAEKKWLVKTFKGVHKCLQTRSLKMCTSTYLSEQISDIIISNPKIPTKALQVQLSKQFELGITKMTAYRAKEKAVKKLSGDFQEQYALLRDYIGELQLRNPDTTVKLDFEEESDPESKTRIFKRIYICLGSLKKGFKVGLRQILGVDGAFMKGPYPG